MEVINEPGCGHAKFARMSEKEVAEKVFSQGSRLESDESGVLISNSSGDCAWIMKKCSEIMKGDVSLRFEDNRTVFSVWCPARKSGSRHGDAHRISCKMTRLPPSTWGFVVDDSAIQRKLMDRFLNIAGIDKDRRIIWGQNSDEIYHFGDRVRDILISNPNDKLILIVDENLDIIDGLTHHSTVSGSRCIKRLLEELDQSHERRLLALVRSANDSSKEIATYTSRAHGFIPKAPIDKNDVLQLIQPWWMKKFGCFDDTDSEGKSPYHSTRSICESRCQDADGDLAHAIEVITALCKVQSGKSLRTRWKIIREKLHALKGDLKSTIMSKGNGIDSVLAEIESF
ncbi:hypothetical protein IV203_032928 [Nitzschia inconspicua]|uniref:Uncharacterized protein n=1 Tax=Nitzschia inconspicua TaxID=303405 RepID=A0A9K3KKJ7_9STRA|nr:hypothetical protein IV203_032928 [Nitzschia inconspicua]